MSPGSNERSFWIQVLLFVGAVALALGLSVARLHEKAESFYKEVGALNARAMEDQLTQSLSMLDLMLNGIASDASLTPVQFGGRFVAELRRMPSLRSLSLLDETGKVIASSNPANIGKWMDTGDFLPPGSELASFLRFGRPWSGRDLADGELTSIQKPVLKGGNSFIPVLKTMQVDGRRSTLLVAINPNYFEAFFADRMRPSGGHAELVRDDGLRLLATNEDTPVGVRSGAAQAIQAFGAASFGQFVIPSSSAPTSESSFTTFRVSRLYPLIIVTNTDQSQLLAPWREESLRLLLIAVPGTALLVFLWGIFHLRQRRFSQQLSAQQSLETERLNAVLNGLPMSVLKLSNDGKIVLGNRAWQSFLNEAQPHEVSLAQDLPYLQVMQQILSDQPEQQQIMANGVAGALGPSGRSFEHECELLTAHGLRWFHIRVHPLALTLLQGAVVMQQEVTERKRNESNLKLAASVFTHAREAIVITDAKANILDVNETFTLITGYSRQEVIGRNPRFLQSGRQPPEFYAAMWQALANKDHWYGELWNRRKNGEVYAEMSSIGAVRDAAGVTQNYVALFTDITAMKEHEQQLEHIAHYDALTALPNRVLLRDRLLHAMSQCQRRDLSLAVVYLDLDGFKQVNDTYGHPMGDQLLITISKRMKAALRDEDTLARMGGDEFVALLAELNGPTQCEPVLERLLACAAEPVLVDGVSLRISSSLGVTLYPQDGADPDQLLRHADQAMYSAKQAGKNRYHMFDVAHDAAVKTQRESLARIKQALHNNEFVLHYQPQVNMRTGALLGVEALIRWQHPQQGLLPPANFLPVIFDHNLSVDLGAWVLERALQQVEQWSAQGVDVRVSINVGARQLQQSGFASQVAGALAMHHPVRAQQLELEVLETSALEDLGGVCDIMNACIFSGVQFALDDFGTGYSSLTHLKHLPAHKLKIDRGFVQDMLTDPDDLAIVKGIIGLAKAFGRDVIAEGVESAELGLCLMGLGCDAGQGFGIARPMPPEDFLTWLGDWRQLNADGWAAAGSAS